MTHPLWGQMLNTRGAAWDKQNTRILHFGDYAAEHDAIPKGPVVSDLSPLAVIQVSGQDAADFLQAQLSNDVLRLGPDRSELAAWCDAKGRVLAIFRVLRHGDDYLILLPRSLVETTLQRLRLFMLRAAVTLHDVSDQWLCAGVFGADAQAAVSSLAAPPEPGAVTGNGNIRLLGLPGSRPCFLVLANAAEVDRIGTLLLTAARPVGYPHWRLDRIQAGQPQVYPATREAFIPQMLNLHWLDAVDFKKGCYPGQEVVARLQHRGTLKRRMFLGTLASATRASPGDSVVGASGGNEGTVVDAAAQDESRSKVLAIIRIDATHDELFIHQAKLELAELPYPTEQ